MITQQVRRKNKLRNGKMRQNCIIDGFFFTGIHNHSNEWSEETKKSLLMQPRANLVDADEHAARTEMEQFLKDIS